MENDNGWAGMAGLLGGTLTAFALARQLGDKRPGKTTEEYESELKRSRDQAALCQQIILDTATALSDAKREVAAAEERARLEKLRTDAVERAFEEELSRSAKLTAEAQDAERKVKGVNEAARADVVRLQKANEELRENVQELREYILKLETQIGLGSAEPPKEGT